jgi:hypothetical protein
MEGDIAVDLTFLRKQTLSVCPDFLVESMM